MRAQFLIIVLACLLWTCKKDHAFDCVTPNGKEITEQRYPGSFEEVRIYDKFDVTVVHDTVFSLVLQGGAQVLQGIETKIEGGVLSIRNLNVCNFVRGYKRKITVELHVPYIKRVINESVGVTQFDKNFKQDSIYVMVANSGDLYLDGRYHFVKAVSRGNGDLYLRGATDNLSVFTVGINYVDARAMTIDGDVFVQTQSIGDCYFTGTGMRFFDYLIERGGNVYLFGEPQGVHKSNESTGSGQLITNF